MKILTFIPVWQRRHITRLCYEGLQRVYEAAPDGFEFRTLIVSSDPEDTALATEYGFDIFEHENKPLGRKFNAGLEYALTHEWDYLFQLNSDDLLATDFWDQFAKILQMETPPPFFGVELLYFYHYETKRLRRFKLYRDGCGIRFIARHLVEIAGYQEDGTFRLWDDHKNAGLDSNSRTRILEKTRIMQLVTRERHPYAMDIKSEVNEVGEQANIHPMGEFEVVLKTVGGAERRKVLQRFPELRKVELMLNKQTL